MEARVANNGYVPFPHVGETQNSVSWCVKCHTDKSECCRAQSANGRRALGDWFYPNGSVVLSNTQFSSLNSHDQPFFAKNRGEKFVRLYRPNTPTFGELRGRFHCVIPDKEGNNQTVYINICRFM